MNSCVASGQNSVSVTSHLPFSDEQKLWGVDLGGTKIEAAIIDPTHPDIGLYRKRIPTERDQGYDHILHQSVKLIEELELLSGMKRPQKIGFGTPGLTDPETGKLKNSNTLFLN